MNDVGPAVGEEVEFSGMGAGSGKIKGEVTLGKDGKTKMYPIACSSCGKETTVPFVPSAGRPVYCAECLEKIKNGTLKVLSPYELPEEGRRKEKTIDSLADIGIEFEERKRAPVASREIRQRDERQSFTQPQRAPNTHTKENRPQPDKDILRSMIKDTLQKK